MAQEEALEPTWVDYRIRADLSRHLDRIRGTAQLSSHLGPMTWSQHSKVGHTKYMKTNARLYGGGKLDLDVFTEIGSFMKELYGRVQVFLKDKDGNVVAFTPTFQCTTRESVLFGSFGDSYGWDSFSHQFSADVVRKITHVEIFQWKE